MRRRKTSYPEGLPAEQELILEHTLGLPDRRSPCRNHFATEPRATDYAAIEALVARGLMFRGRGIPGGLTYYHVSEAGMAAAGFPGRCVRCLAAPGRRHDAGCPRSRHHRGRAEAAREDGA